MTSSTMTLKEQAQFLADIVVRRQAKNKGVELPVKYWNLSHWKKPYQLQVIHAHKLVKIYGFDLIHSSLHSFKGKRLYSLGAKWFDDIIHETAETIKLKEAKPKAKIEVSESTSTPSAPRKQFGESKTGLEGLE